jgi:hypothetical protein
LRRKTKYFFCFFKVSTVAVVYFGVQIHRKFLEIKFFRGAPGETRTPNLLIRSQTLYPIELRVHYSSIVLGGLD